MARKRRGSKRHFRLLITASILLTLAYYAASPAWDLMANQKTLEQTKQKLKELNEKKSALKEKIKMLNKDEHLELKAREELGLVREGEEAYLIVKVPPTTPLSKPKAKLPEADKTFFYNAKTWITGILGLGGNKVE